mgnify:CR=1 FL=1
MTEISALKAGLIADIEAADTLDALEGLRRNLSRGHGFDPHRDQAMFEIPNPAVPNNTVVQVVQAGYVIGDRVLRPAMVGVAKGGPKAEAAAEATAEADKG